MMSIVFNLSDDSMGIPVDFEAELVDFEDGDPPEIIINDILYGENYLNKWTLSERYITYLKNKVFQEWCLHA
jgi:hypothetical protein